MWDAKSDAMTHIHKLDIVCVYCVIEKCKQREKLLEFVKKIARNDLNLTPEEMQMFPDELKEARELLKEIGEA